MRSRGRCWVRLSSMGIAAMLASCAADEDPGLFDPPKLDPLPDVIPAMWRVDATADATTDDVQDAATDATADARIDATADTTADARIDATADATMDARTDATADTTADARIDATADVPTDATASALACANVQWWNSTITYQHVSYGWNDTDLRVPAGTPVVLRHASRLERVGVYDWGYMPEFTDLVTRARFRFVHLRPQAQRATVRGREYPAGFVVGLSGGDTRDTGYPTYSTGAHLCVQTLVAYRTAFAAGRDACR